ncbi:MAG TPA: hypothetical protein VGP68_23040 [Gemmataceae bacterium]|jgi:hypothetical protein|nr:hypothetical protein [Gemmataceae bacterium]
MSKATTPLTQAISLMNRLGVFGEKKSGASSGWATGAGELGSLASSGGTVTFALHTGQMMRLPARQLALDNSFSHARQRNRIGMKALLAEARAETRKALIQMWDSRLDYDDASASQHNFPVRQSKRPFGRSQFVFTG